MPYLLKLAWRELRVNGRALWVFCACLVLGVLLVSAGGGLYRVVSAGLLADTRALLGGDLEVDGNAPLPPATLDWIERSGEVSLVIELDTMLGTPDGNFLRAELQSVDEQYPLYGKLELAPSISLASALALKGETYGAAIDTALAEQLGVAVGDSVLVGSLSLEVRALVVHQPDRRLNADWRGAPLLLDEDALQASGLIQPGSRVDYKYHLRTDRPVDAWRADFYTEFPDKAWQVRTFYDRSQRIAERLDQIASGLLIIGLSTLFVGGLGVFISIQTYLDGRLKTIAILRTVGMRRRSLAGVYLIQVTLLAGGSSLAGTLIGIGLALAGAGLLEGQIPIGTTLENLVQPAIVAFAFGMLTAFAFAFPAIGRALSARPAALFRGSQPGVGRLTAGWWLASLVCVTSIVLLVLLAIPDPLFGLGFLTLVITLLLLLEVIVRVIRNTARALETRTTLLRSFALRYALANLHRPGNSLRTALLSLGSALTLLVACTLVVSSLLRALNTTIPEDAPALVLYDVLENQVAEVEDAIRLTVEDARVELVPLVRSRIVAVNGQALVDRPDLDGTRMSDMARGDYKLSYRAGNVDDVSLLEGNWWEEPVTGRARMAMEDREVNRLGLKLGDVMTFSAAGREVEAEIQAIYKQKGLQTRFWFEGILSDGAIDNMIVRRVGAAYLDDAAAIEAQKRVASAAANVITVRTARLLDTARGILAKAASGLALVAGISLVASLLVLSSVMAAGRTRQVYDATVLHTLGARFTQIRRGLCLEYLLLAVVTSLFAVLLGAAIALPLLHFRLKLPGDDLIWLGALVAIFVSGSSLALGARYLLYRLRINPVELLRGS